MIIIKIQPYTQAREEFELTWDAIRNLVSAGNEYYVYPILNHICTDLIHCSVEYLLIILLRGISW